MIVFPPVRVPSLFAGRLARDIAAFAPTHVVSLIDPTLPKGGGRSSAATSASSSGRSSTSNAR